jgi:pimeloyl-ACP methyl ester carboxylesterase
LSEAAADEAQLADLVVEGRPLRLEYAWIAPDRKDRPLLVFLHEGLGSLAMWRHFPRALCDRGAYRGLVYSRPGYGRSTPRGAAERWGVDFMHAQAEVVLPALLAAVGIAQDERPWLFGHSDGASIALLYAARFPKAVAGVIAVAPHVFVEPLSIDSIEIARVAYADTDLRSRLARYHEDVDSAFWGWNDIWLDPAFRAWNIEAELSRIECAVLAVQGVDDEYGTLEQVRRVARAVPGTRLVELPECRHSPHRDQPERLIGEVVSYLAQFERREWRGAAPAPASLQTIGSAQATDADARASEPSIGGTP